LRRARRLRKFAAEIRRKRVQRLIAHSNWQWHLDEVSVKINGEIHYLWRTVDHEGEVLESHAICMSIMQFVNIQQFVSCLICKIQITSDLACSQHRTDQTIRQNVAHPTPSSETGLRNLRRARGLSINQIAGHSGFSSGLISQIERGLSTASVRILTKLADALDVGIGDLISDGTQTEKVADVVVVRNRQTVKFGKSGITKELLIPSSQSKKLDLYLLHLKPDDTGLDEPCSHQGVEAGVVLEGSFELEVDGRRYFLNKGDSCRFASMRSHRFRNAGTRNATVLWVNYRNTE
jgi:transcriptional regulator with XRE-family HTH domain